MSVTQEKNGNIFSNREVSEYLRTIAAAYLLKDPEKSRFKIIAYERAADTIEHLSRELRHIWEDGKLDEVPTFGKSLTSNLDEYFRTGRSKHFDSILEGIPSTVFILMRVPGIGPKKAYKLVTQLKLFNEETIFQDLQSAATADRIATMESFGEKSQQDIVDAIARYQKQAGKQRRMPLPIAAGLAAEIISYLKKHPGVKRADALGSLRRQVNTIGDIDIAVEAEEKDTTSILQHFIQYSGTDHIDNIGDKKASVLIGSGVRVDLRVQDGESYGSMLQYFTGSKAHNIKLREYAMKKQLSLSEYGIVDTSEGKEKARGKDDIMLFDSEEKFYGYLGLAYIPPELREGTNEIEYAKKNQLPQLVELKEIKGDLHTHSSYDLKPSHDLGANTYEEMLESAAKLGYKYIGFADHNPKTSGLTADEIVSIMKDRHRYIEQIRKNNKLSVYPFVGLEVDILPSGELALPLQAFDYVDYLIVSVHSAFTLSREDMTQRVMKALSHPKVKVLGHPTGRLINKREGFELEWNKVFDYCMGHNIAVEINSSPSRLDLPDVLVREGLSCGLKYIINTDAHVAEQMELMSFGVSVARRGWCAADSIVNTMGYNSFKKWIEGK